MTAAEWDAVAIRFPDTRRAIGPASLAAAPGERVLVLGPSGSGKSSLLLALTGLIPEAIPAAVTGATQICGIDAKSRRAAEWADRVAHVFQAPERNLCGMSVEEEIVFALEQAGLCEATIRAGVADALTAVGLDVAMAGRLVATLSGGEKQRVGLAATLAQGGDVLLIDEPTAHLDPAASQRIHALLSAPSHAATVIVDHRLDGLIDAIDRVVVLDDSGRVFAEGTPRQVFRDDIEALDALGIWVPEAARLDQGLRAAGIVREPMPLRFASALENLAATSAAVDALSCYCAAAPLRRSTLGRPVVTLTDAECRVPGGPAVVTGVSLAVREREVLALLGPNGAGKSTLGLALAGVVPLASGRREGAAGAVVLQNPDLQFVTGSVADELAASLPKPTRQDFDAEPVLRRWGLDGLGLRHPLALSEGQKRRLAIAALDLVASADVLVLDEPTAGLDRRGAATLEAAIAERGRAVVIITHDMDLAVRLADTIAVMAHGRLVATGSADSLFADADLTRRHGLETPPAVLVRRWLSDAARQMAC